MDPGRLQSSEPNRVRPVASRILRVKLIDGTLVSGQVNINQEAGYDRVSDLLTSPGESFLNLFNVTAYDTASENPIRHDTLFVNKRQIIWAKPDDEEK